MQLLQNLLHCRVFGNGKQRFGSDWAKPCLALSNGPVQFVHFHSAAKPLLWHSCFLSCWANSQTLTILCHTSHYVSNPIVSHLHLTVPQCVQYLVPLWQRSGRVIHLWFYWSLPDDWLRLSVPPLPCAPGPTVHPLCYISSDSWDCFWVKACVRPL